MSKKINSELKKQLLNSSKNSLLDQPLLRPKMLKDWNKIQVFVLKTEVLTFIGKSQKPNLVYYQHTID